MDLTFFRGAAYPAAPSILWAPNLRLQWFMDESSGGSHSCISRSADVKEIIIFPQTLPLVQWNTCLIKTISTCLLWSALFCYSFAGALLSMTPDMQPPPPQDRDDYWHLSIAFLSNKMLQFTHTRNLQYILWRFPIATWGWVSQGTTHGNPSIALLHSDLHSHHILASSASQSRVCQQCWE